MAGPLFLLCSYYGKYPWLGLVLIMVLAAQWEFYRLAETKGSRPVKSAGFITGAALCLFLFFRWGRLPALLAAGTVLLFLLEIPKRKEKRVVENVSITLFGAIYLGLLPAHLLLFP